VGEAGKASRRREAEQRRRTLMPGDIHAGVKFMAA